MNDDRISRRALLRWGVRSGLAGLAGATGLGAWARLGATPNGPPPPDHPALIVIRLDGGPSQLETFDPHPHTRIGGPTAATDTSLPGVQFGADYPRLAERADRLAIVRSVVTTEGEHSRGRYLMRTGHPVTPTANYPSMGAVVAHDIPTPHLELPPHIALLDPDPPQGGVLGPEVRAFAVGDPRDPIQDLETPVGLARLDRRLQLTDAAEATFRRGRDHAAQDTQHDALRTRARALMGSAQLDAFRVDHEPAAVQAAYGDTPFGRACLAARRLVETGVPSVEVTLSGWDTHVDHFNLHRPLASTLDAALSTLLDDLAQRDLLRRTLVWCGGEFGRTPRINRLDGRDHWTRGFSVLLAGRGLRPGVVLGATDPDGEAPPTDPVSPQDLFATAYATLGIDYQQWYSTLAGRPLQLNEGQPIPALLA